MSQKRNNSAITDRSFTTEQLHFGVVRLDCGGYYPPCRGLISLWTTTHSRPVAARLVRLFCAVPHPRAMFHLQPTTRLARLPAPIEQVRGLLF
jgi:hypothetical protein